MRNAFLLLLAMTLPTTPAVALEPVTAPGENVEARVDGDLDGDGARDLAYIVGTDEWRELRVVLSSRAREEPPEALDLGLTPLGPGTLAIIGDVLQLEDLAGGTTAVSSTRRFRYDGLRKRMRLIGIDATLYSRTFAHDGFEASWNLLNGDTVTRELKLARDGSEAAYRPAREIRAKRRTRPIWLSEAPDPETLLEEMRES